MVSALIDRELNPGKLMTWMYVDLASQTTFSLCLDFDELTERLINVRYVQMSLEDYMIMDPRLDRWLLEMGPLLHHEQD